MPPCEGRRKRVKVRITRCILSEADICNFFDNTKNFGKRFYTIRYNSNVDGEGTTYRDIAIEAIAVSRDLVYKIVWSIGCTTSPPLADMESSVFPHSYSPKRDWHRSWFFPQYREQDENPCIMNAFDYRGFIEIDTIEEV